MFLAQIIRFVGSSLGCQYPRNETYLLGSIRQDPVFLEVKKRVRHDGVPSLVCYVGKHRFNGDEATVIRLDHMKYMGVSEN